MKILTLNTHSYMEENFNDKYSTLIKCLVEENFDIIALQEVNQLINSSLITNLDNYYKKANDLIEIKNDNFVFKIINSLKEYNVNYYWSYLPTHIGYDKYDEGVALLSKYPIEDTNCILLSPKDSYHYYKNRKVLGIKVKNNWFYSIHLGWWNDKEDSLQYQVKRLVDSLDMTSKVYLMGDFNSPADTRNEGYDYILDNFSFYDTFNLAKEQSGKYTVIKKIDGWKDTNEDKMRIDLILKNNNLPVQKSKVIFDNKNHNIVSDHFGLYITE